MTAMADAAHADPGAGVSLGDILRQQFSPLRLVTGAAALLLLGTASTLLLDSPWALPGLLWYVATPWVILAGLARTPAGPAPHFQRFLASLGYPAALAVLATAATILETGHAVAPLVALVWAFALPVALQRWQQWRATGTPSRIAGTAALLLFVLVQVVITFSAVDMSEWVPDAAGFQLSPEVLAGVVCAGLLLLVTAGLAPTLWAAFPGRPLFTIVTGLGLWLIVLVLDTPAAAWLTVALLAFCTPMFSGPPGRYAPRRLPCTPTGAALILATLAALVAVVAQASGLAGPAVGTSADWQAGPRPVSAAVPALWIALLHVYLVRDLAVWRLLADLSPGEPVGPVIWLFWLALLHGAGLLFTHLGLPFPVAEMFSVPWFADGFEPHHTGTLVLTALAAIASAAIVLAVSHLIGTRRHVR